MELLKRNYKEYLIKEPKMNSVYSCRRFIIKPMNLDKELGILHKWLNMNYAKFWMLQGTTQEQVRTEFEHMEKQGNRFFIGEFEGSPAFMAVFYDASKDQISNYYNYKKGDFGMHVLVAPAEKPIHGFTWNVFKTIMEFMFSYEEVKRVVVEPDRDNEKIHKLNKRAGFEYLKEVKLPEKWASLALCTRKQYLQAIENENQ